MNVGRNICSYLLTMKTSSVDGALFYFCTLKSNFSLSQTQVILKAQEKQPHKGFTNFGRSRYVPPDFSYSSYHKVHCQQDTILSPMLNFTHFLVNNYQRYFFTHIATASNPKSIMYEELCLIIISLNTYSSCSPQINRATGRRILMTSLRVMNDT